MSPDHLMVQADGLLDRIEGAGRQADKRRAVSTAYYAVFHTVAGAAAHQLIGDTHFRTPEYVAVWRAVKHAGIAELCKEVAKSEPPNSLRPFWPTHGFNAELRAFATLFPELRRERERADYDPSYALKVEEARDAVRRSREAIDQFKAGSSQHRIFATLLITRF